MPGEAPRLGMDQPTDDRPTIHVDDHPVRALGGEMTGAEILALAGAQADAVDLFAEGHQGLCIAPEQPVPVQEGSRFRTRPRRGDDVC